MPTCETTLPHPCYEASAKHTHGRVHLPVAPRCNIQCQYCSRKFDCVNESRPGVTSRVLQPWQAARWFGELRSLDPSISVAGIAGPGDPFANADATLETLRLVREDHPDVHLCVSSNGLAMAPHVPALAELGLRHATITINAVDPEIGRGVYAWVRDGTRILRGRDGAALLWERQQQAITALVAHGITVKVNAIVVPGVNDDHLPEVARTVAGMGARLFNLIPLIPTAGTGFAEVPEPAPALVAGLRAAARVHLPQMEHCQRCRADAAGKLGQDLAIATELLARAADSTRSGQERTRIAVASHEGLFVNRHLGETDELLIFAKDGAGFRQVGVRRTPPAGGGGARWQDLAELIDDCRAILVAGIGPAPSQVLGEAGIRVLEVQGQVDDLLPVAWEGGDIRTFAKPPTRCGDGCGGNGLGCA